MLQLKIVYKRPVKRIFLQKGDKITAFHKKASGILLPIFSLPNNYGIGTLGRSAFQFIEFLKKKSNVIEIDVNNSYQLLGEIIGETAADDIINEVQIEIKYEGYIDKARKEANRMLKMDKIKLPQDVDYTTVDNLALEARQKLNQIKPYTLGQASRISGINPSDIQVLAIWLKQRSVD